MNVLTPFDLVIFFGSLLLVMGAGLWAGRKEETASDYYLAGRTTRWWGVAASIFGSNVSANHIIGMMGVGFGVGFAQSHFEISAIAGLLLLCYGFLPVYRKLGIYTLSDYLGRRYGETSRVLYALIMLAVIVVIQTVPGFYIGSRSLNVLLQQEAGAPIDQTYYTLGIVLMAVVTGTYTIVGGLKAVIVTDVIQSVLMLIAGIVVAVLTFAQPEIGGWAGMRAMDAARGDERLMRLFQPSDHADLPWSGVLSGLMVLHFYYWGTNQFIVQRALAARSDSEARLGIIIAGFFKLLIPFMSIGGGIAAFYLFQARGIESDADAAFTELLKTVVAPVGFGVVGLVAAGVVGAILSSIDSMLNSAATIFTFDFYKRYVRRGAGERELILVGSVAIAFFIFASAALTIFTMDPNSEDHFFLQIASHQGKLVAGVVVAFALGMFWRRATSPGAIASIVIGILVSYGLPPLYKDLVASGQLTSLSETFGRELNFMHSVFVAAICAAVAHVVVSLLTQSNADAQHGDDAAGGDERSRLTWTDLGGHDPAALKRGFLGVGAALLLWIVLGILVYTGTLSSTVSAWVAALFTWALFAKAALTNVRRRAAEGAADVPLIGICSEDRFWAGLLAAVAIFMMFYFA